MYLRRIFGVTLSLPALLALSCSDSGENVGEQHDAGTDQRAADHHVEADVTRDRADGEDATEMGDAADEGEGDAMSPADGDAGDALVPGPCGDGVLNLGEACDGLAAENDRRAPAGGTNRMLAVRADHNRFPERAPRAQECSSIGGWKFEPRERVLGGGSV
jgi:hypothetical protein